MQTPHTLYTIRRCKKDDTMYGPAHGSDDGDKTLCGLVLDENFYITDNAFDGTITCKKCLAKVRLRSNKG